MGFAVGLSVMLLVLLVLFAVWMVRKGRQCGGNEKLLDAFTLGCEQIFNGNAEKKVQVRKMNEALLISEDERFARARKLYCGMWLLAFLGCVAGSVIARQGMKVVAVEEVHRPEFGQEKSVLLKVDGLEEVDEVHFSVSGKEPGAEEMEAVFDEAFEALKAEVFPDNDIEVHRGEESRNLYGEESRTLYGEESRSLHGEESGTLYGEELRTLYGEESRSLYDYETDGSLDDASLNRSYIVQKSLDLPEMLESGIRVEYRSSDVEVLSDRGFLISDDIPDDGISLTLTVMLAYGEYEKNYEIPIRVMPTLENLTPEEVLERLLAEADAETRKQAVMKLPEEMDGSRIRYREEAASPYPILVMALGAAGAMYAAAKESLKKKYEKRSEELEESFPEMLSKIGTLISAGMSIRSAWVRVAEDYRAGVRNQVRKKEYVYEEMLITARQLLNGQAEGEAYVKFGKRCGRQEYVRFGNILAKNLRQGIAGLQGELKEEMDRALVEWKTGAIRKGELAGTRMLFPMILMLGVVLIAVAAPAFLAF